jgi:hypothetical protein
MKYAATTTSISFISFCFVINSSTETAYFNINHKALRPYIAKFSYFKRTESIGKGVLHMILEGKNGSVWINASNKPVFQIKIPHYEKLRV